MTPDQIRAQLPHTLSQTNFPGLGPKYRGKVRDVYDQGDTLVMITTDRVSAFDRVLGTIPFKGEVLNAMTQAGFDATQEIIPNAVISRPDPSVFVVHKCKTYAVEWVVRAYATGSLWRDLEAGVAQENYQIAFPKGIKKDEALPHPILTPSTKAPDGEHDQPTSKAAIIRAGLLTEEEFARAEHVALTLFKKGQAIAAQRGLILVDTKYELGVAKDGQLMLVDEVHTPDSSRYWVTEEYQPRFEAGRAQRMLDKENLRQWLADQGFMGHGTPPKLSEAIKVSLSRSYMDVHTKMLGDTFLADVGPTHERIAQNLKSEGLL